MIKGKGNYCAVLIDLEKSKLIALLAGRTTDEIQKVLMGWGKEVLEKIDEVSIDLWKGYKNLVLKLMPNAQVVADRFHVMVQINQELDKQRKQERLKAENLLKTAQSELEKVNSEKVLARLKKSKYAKIEE